MFGCGDAFGTGGRFNTCFHLVGHDVNALIDCGSSSLVGMNKLAIDLHVPVTRIAEIVHERRGISPDTALRLARYFNTSARFWLNLQAAYDLEVAQDEIAKEIERDVRPSTALHSPAQ